MSRSDRAFHEDAAGEVGAGQGGQGSCGGLTRLLPGAFLWQPPGPQEQSSWADLPPDRRAGAVLGPRNIPGEAEAPQIYREGPRLHEAWNTRRPSALDRSLARAQPPEFQSGCRHSLPSQVTHPLWTSKNLGAKRQLQRGWEGDTLAL